MACAIWTNSLRLFIQGLGYELAIEFAKRDYTVFATARSRAKMSKLETMGCQVNALFALI